MPETVPSVPPGEYTLMSMPGKHDSFIVVSALIFALLFGEEGVYTYLAYGQASTTGAAALIGLSMIVVFAGFLASFYLPRVVMPEGDQTKWIPHTLNFLFGQVGISVCCVAIAFTAAILLFIPLAGGDLIAISWLIRDGFMYIVLGILVYHGFILFVRYLNFLYQSGGADKLKVISFEVGATVFLLIFGLYQYTVDLLRVIAASPNQGILALHLTLRDIILAVLVLIIYTFQFSRAGDH
jgi:hypothetical protein